MLLQLLRRVMQIWENWTWGFEKVGHRVSVLSLLLPVKGLLKGVAEGKLW